MRTENSIKNSTTALVGNVISFAVSFLARVLFIKILGVEYLGLNGLFTNILSMLSIFELGIGNAIVFNLYKPIANNDEKKISSLINFYRKSYNIIASLILTFGIILIPFLKYIVTDISVDVNIYIVYILFLISTYSSYFIAYKRNLIIANQHNYIINIIHMLSIILLNIVQLIILYFYKNYYLYLIIKILFQVFENIIISTIATKKYKFLKKYKKEQLDKKIEKDILKRVKALLFHKIGGIVVLGTDNIIISSFLGISTVGLYTNYSTIIEAVNTIFGQIFSTTTASVGNLLVSEDEKKKYDIFNKMRFLNFWVSVFTATCLLVIIQPFISIWVGNEYKLGMFVVCTIVFNYFQKMQRQTYCTFKDSAGIWNEDKYVPLLESLLNILFSILCLKIFGLAGVFIGTIISGLALWCYSYPKFVYKKLFNRSYLDYAKETVGFIVVFLVIATLTYFISIIIILENLLLQVIINTLICLIVPNMILFFVYRKTDNFKYFLELIKKLKNRILNK